jgi:hypothetical protein
MKPIKALQPFATWLMRLAVVFFVFIIFFSTLKGFDYKSIQFYVALAYIIFGSLLFIGGFISKPGITVFSGLMIFLVSVYRIVMFSSEKFDTTLVQYSLVATISLYFFTAGNKN